MNTNYRRKKEPLENRQLIVEAAIELAAEIGLEKLTLDAVAKRASLSKGGLLHHFPKKESLIEELFSDSLKKFSDALRIEQRENEPLGIAYLKVAINDTPTTLQNRSMYILLQATVFHESYRELLAQWYRDNVVSDLDNIPPAQLAAILIADGLWYANLFGAFSISQRQKAQIIQLLEKL